VAQAVEPLSSKHEALSLNSSTAKKKKKKRNTKTLAEINSIYSVSKTFIIIIF
jgi:hypothetical protein